MSIYYVANNINVLSINIKYNIKMEKRKFNDTVIQSLVHFAGSSLQAFRCTNI